MNRRGFLRSTALVAVAAPVLTVQELVPVQEQELAQPERLPLPPVIANQMLTPAVWNQMVARVNELSRMKMQR